MRHVSLSILIHQINLQILCSSSDQWSLLMLKVNLAYNIVEKNCIFLEVVATDLLYSD